MNSDPENSRGDPGRPAPVAKPQLFDRVFLGPQGVRSGWRAALYASLFFLLLIVVQLVAALFHYPPAAAPGPLGPGQLFPSELAYVACAVAAALAMGAIEGRPFGDYGMPVGNAFRGRFWQGALWGMAQITALMLLLRVFGGYSFGARAIGGGVAAEYALLWAAAFVVVAVNEEFLFRGYLQFTLASGMGFWPAAILLSLAFGGVHWSNPGEGPAGVASVCVFGMFWCLTLRRTGDLWFAIGMHAAYDFGETYVYSVPDSGTVMRGHLLNASLHGPAWLTGGSAGPEGSALAFVVLAIMFVLFDRIYFSRRIL